MVERFLLVDLPDTSLVIQCANCHCEYVMSLHVVSLRTLTACASCSEQLDQDPAIRAYRQLGTINNVRLRVSLAASGAST